MPKASGLASQIRRSRFAWRRKPASTALCRKTSNGVKKPLMFKMPTGFFRMLSFSHLIVSQLVQHAESVGLGFADQAVEVCLAQETGFDGSLQEDKQRCEKAVDV